MKNLLEFILIHLVEHPEDVTITERATGDTTQYVIHVHPDDMGRVILTLNQYENIRYRNIM